MSKWNGFWLAVHLVVVGALGILAMPGVVAVANAVGKPTALATALFYVGGWAALLLADQPVVTKSGE
jgi:hypothetical protein